jgi:hypothetical protein
MLNAVARKDRNGAVGAPDWNRDRQGPLGKPQNLRDSGRDSGWTESAVELAESSAIERVVELGRQRSRRRGGFGGPGHAASLLPVR